jgi:hypothetical protein
MTVSSQQHILFREIDGRRGLKLEFGPQVVESRLIANDSTGRFVGAEPQITIEMCVGVGGRYNDRVAIRRVVALDLRAKGS